MDLRKYRQESRLDVFSCPVPCVWLFALQFVELFNEILMFVLGHPVQGAAFSMVLRGTEKTVIDRKKVAYEF